MVADFLSNIEDGTMTAPAAKEARVEKTIESVIGKVLKKLEGYVDGVTPEGLSPQALKQVTATLKDIRELQAGTDTDVRVVVEFDHPEWKA
ncbi:MAG: hypothetical protein IKA47_09980 [Oscillospiraceae bacterium]|nr:hypothetical protein [Oscillospiraceae bacterium]